MSTETNAVQEAAENPIETLRSSRNTFLMLLGLAGAGIILFIFGQTTYMHFLSFLGMAVFALPLVLSLCLGLPIIDIGPVFRTVDTPIGNVIHRTLVPDIGGQMAANLALTLIRAILMFFLSVIIMPLLLVICLIAYKLGRRKALKYAEKNGIDKNTVPRIPAIIFPIYIGVLVVAIIIANLVHKADVEAYNEEYEADMKVYGEVLDDFLANIDTAVPAEYFAEAYKGDSYTGGFVARFEIDGKTVLCGKVDLGDYASDVLSSSGAYYILDDTVYIDKYNTKQFEVCKDEAVIKILKDRFPEANFGNDMTLDGGEKDDRYFNDVMKPEGAVMYLVVEYNGDRHLIHLDADHKLIGYGFNVTSGDMRETQFLFEDKPVSDSYKEAAKALVSGNAEIK